MGELPALFPLLTPPLSDVASPAPLGSHQLTLGSSDVQLGDVTGLLANEGVPVSGTTTAAAPVASPFMGRPLNGASASVLTPPVDDPLSASEGHVGGGSGKRPLAEAGVYSSAEPPCDRTALTRNGQLQQDPVEEELCERMRQQAMLNAVDPTAFHKSKFVRKSTSDA